VPDDAPPLLYWMYGVQDPGLFQNDLNTDYARINFARPVYVFVFFIASFFVEPILAFKALQILILIISAIFFYKIGRALQDQTTGLVLSLSFIVLAPLFRNFLAYQRGFGMVLMLIFFYYFLLRKHVAAGFFIVLQAFTYPPACLISLVIYGLSFIDFQKKSFLDLNKQKITILLATVFVVALILLGGSLAQNYTLGSLYSYEEMKQMPEFYAGGRGAILPFAGVWRTAVSNSFFFVLPELRIQGFSFDILWAIPLVWRLGALLALTLAFIFVLQKRLFNLPKELWLLLFAGVILFYLAKLFALQLYVPGR